MLSSIKRRIILAAVSILFLSVVLPFNMFSGMAFAQSRSGQCPQGKVCRVTGTSSKGTLLPKSTKTTTTTNLVVNANQDLPGLDTGIDLSVGTNITITASGQATFGIGSTQDCNTTEETQPDGQRLLTDGTLCPGKIDSSAVLPSAPVGELLASYGSSGWFGVGSSDGFSASTGGRLFLLYNDISGQYGNNSGSYQVTVTTSIASALTITGLYTRDGNGNVQTTFALGAAIQYVVNVNNSSGNSMTINIHYQAFGPNQNSIFDQSYIGVTIPQGASGWYIQGTVPTNAPTGTYTMQVTVLDQNNNNNQDMQKGGQFTVTAAAAWCQCTTYVANYFSLPATYPDAKNWPGWLSGLGWKQVSVPSIGDIVVFQPKFGSGIDQKHGHVGIITSVTSVNKNQDWHITVEGSNQGNSGWYTKDGCTNVNNIPFKSYPKSDAYISYWTR